MGRRWQTIRIWQETYEEIIGLNADAEKKLKRAVGVAKTMNAIVKFARDHTKSSSSGDQQHATWSDDLGE